jgi:hypothetical protein
VSLRAPTGRGNLPLRRLSLRGDCFGATRLAMTLCSHFLEVKNLYLERGYRAQHFQQDPHPIVA